MIRTHIRMKPGPEVIKLFSCSTQLGSDSCVCETCQGECSSRRNIDKALKFTWMQTLLTLTAAVVLSTAVIVFCYQIYQPRNTDSFTTVPKSENATEPHCNDIPVAQRSDCWPQGGASQQLCLAKGCCWSPSGDNLGGAPSCYYASNYVGYTIDSSKKTPTGMRYTLKWTAPSGWPSDIKTLALDVIYETQQRLRFKIYDPANQRYEVPIKVDPGEGSIPSPTDYEVAVPSSGPFKLTVKRTYYEDVLFSTVGAAPLVFADQFLQLGSVLASDHLYGLGEHRSRFKLSTNWTKLVMWTRDQPPMPNANLYGDHPFYLNIEPNRFAYGVFLLNSNAMGVEIQPSPAITFRTTGGILDFYVFTGPTPDNVVQQYTELIGRPFMPPYWALGFNLCRWGYGGTIELRKVIDRMRAAKMPYDVQWNDIDYMHGLLDWTYDSAGKYAGLPAAVDDLHSNGQHYIIIIDPGISNEQKSGSYPPYDDGLQRDIFIKNPNGSGPIIGVVWPGTTAFPDFFHPNSTEYWTKQAQFYYNQVKFDGLWIDMNEPSNFWEGSKSGCPNNSLENPPYVPAGIIGGKLRARTLCASAKQYLSTHYNLHSLYGYSETVASMSALNKLRPNKRSIVISRSTFPGSGVHGGHWLGDNNAKWEDMAYSISGIMSFQLFGISLVGADICGFFGDTNPELCARWMQLGAFYPFMRNHNSIGFKDQDPASFDTATQNIMRTALETRYALLPYLYSLFYRSHVDGTPVVRPIFFQYSTDIDETIFDLDKQFMLGTSLLITPALSQGTLKGQGYLPRDRWYDFYTHSYVDSPGNYTTFDLPLERINIQVRGASIIPIQEPNVTTALSRKNKFSLYVALNNAGSASGEFYWDDGESIDAIANRNYNLIEFSVSRRKLQAFIAHGGYTAEPMILGQVYILGIEIGPTSVMVNGNSTTQYTYEDQTLTVFGMSADLLKHFDITWTI